MEPKMRLNKRTCELFPLWLLVIGFSVVYALITFVNHYLFRTYALDLGFYTQNAWCYAHGTLNTTAFFNGFNHAILADHFDLYLLIISPLIYIFGSYTLLVVQFVAVLAGGIGVYKLGRLHAADMRLLLLVTASFYAFFGIFSAFSFDYHSNVVAAMFVPWLLYFIKKQSYKVAFLFVVLILIGKENMAIFLFFICTGLLWDYRKDQKAVVCLLLFAFFCVIYFLIIVQWLMPKLSASSDYHLNSSYVLYGESVKDTVVYLLSHPIETLKLLFVNNTNAIGGDFVKAELHICLLASGVFMLIAKPNYLWMLIPIYLQKLLSNNPSFWGVNYQYCIEFAPVIAIGTLLVLLKIKNNRLQWMIAGLLLVMTGTVTVRNMYHTEQWKNNDTCNIFSKRHYRSLYQTEQLYGILKTIPPKASITATSSFTPHLALRHQLFSFPLQIDLSDYVLISKKEDSFPYRLPDVLKITEQIRNDNRYIVIEENEDFILYKLKL